MSPARRGHPSSTRWPGKRLRASSSGRLLLRLAAGLLALSGACARGDKRASPTLGTVPNASGSAPQAVDGATLPPPELAQFSAPIGAGKVGRLDVVAGLVASEGVVRAMAFSAEHVVWTSDVLRGVAWAPDAEVRLHGAGGGVAVVWHGLRDGKSGRTMVLLGPGGERRGEPVEVGSSVCATSEGTAWLGPHGHGPTNVFARRWTDTEAKSLVSLPSDRDPSLVCGDHQVQVLGDGDDDLVAISFVPGDATARPPMTVLREADFSEELREHDEYAVDDDLALLRVGTSGAMAIRDVPRAGAPGPWRTLKHELSGDDDAVAVDGDRATAVIVATHDLDEACPGAGSTESVQAFIVDRKTGADSVVVLSPGDCEQARGPFWIGSTAEGPVVAWVERPTKLASKAAPIAGVAYRWIRPEGVRAGRIALEADAVADGGCDDRGCFVAALVREPGTDGMRPAPIRVFAYP